MNLFGRWVTALPFLASWLAVADHATPPAITNAVALLGVSAEQAACRPAYEITGTVCSGSVQDFVVEADGVRFVTHYDLDGSPDVREGDIVRLGGEVRLSAQGLPSCFFSCHKVVGHVDLPPPSDVETVDVASGHHDLHVVRVRGTVTDVFRDDIDRRFVYLVLRANGSDAYITTGAGDERDWVGLLGADMRVTGTCKPIVSTRLYMGWAVSVCGMKDVEVLRPAETDPRTFPPLEDWPHASPQALAGLDRRSVSGTVLAAWQGRYLMVRTGAGHLHRVELMPGQALPPSGSLVTVGGILETDFYHVNLTHALVHVDRVGGDTDDVPTRIAPNAILKGHPGERVFDPRYFGRLVTMSGIVEAAPQDAGATPSLRLNSEGTAIPLDISAAPELAAEIKAGSRLQVTGVCVLDVPNWRPFAAFPKIRGFSLVVRQASDVRVLAAAPWWTPVRFWSLIGVLLALLAGVFAWGIILNRLVVRKGRELAEEQIAHGVSMLRVDERTRLAVELHDTLSQNLAGLACQVAAARKVLSDDPPTAHARLETIERMLHSCRTELRNCLADLRSEMLEETDFEVAVRKTLERFETDARIVVRFAIMRARLQDLTAHALLCIVRELVSNALRHGRATYVAVAGSVEENVLMISVKDNGGGFDPASCPGPAQGHFGLEGIRGRVQRLGGSFSLTSVPNRGTRAVVRIVLTKEEV